MARILWFWRQLIHQCRLHCCSGEAGSPETVFYGQGREVLLKGKAQYSWPIFKLEILFINSYMRRSTALRLQLQLASLGYHLLMLDGNTHSVNKLPCFLCKKYSGRYAWSYSLSCSLSISLSLFCFVSSCLYLFVFPSLFWFFMLLLCLSL
jgi:hypothetical protein